MDNHNIKTGDHRTGLEVAVIGMAARLPGAANIDEFRENLENGVEAAAFFSDDELEQAGIEKDLIRNPAYVKAKGMLDNIEYFDALFFDYSPREAEMMDPQMRMFHECVWEALENAGYTPDTYEGLIGIYAGADSNLHWMAWNFPGALNGHVPSDPSEQFEAGNMNSRDYLCTQVSYKLNLTGPAVTVQTACSTSLVAIHQAWQSLLSGDCDMALAGGVCITLPKKSGYLYQKGLVHSPDGHCRSFDAAADGTLPGDGIGIVVLKRLEDAVRDGDGIDAVIKGSAVNNDGRQKVDFTAPGVKGQAAVVRAALLTAEVEPETITCIETHGTGTKIGDPIEIRALKQVFNTGKKGFCALGSVKSNLGHLIAAAGAAGFIKTVLALKHRCLPPSLHFKHPNPEIDFDNSPFYVNTGLKEWKAAGHPLRAGVSSFGIGGTNAHVVLEAWSREQGAGSEQRRDYQLILLSAKTQPALDKMTENLANHLTKNPGIHLADAAYTLQVGRAAFKHRKALVCRDVKEAIEILSTPGTPLAQEFAAAPDTRPLVFMFPGQGSQYVNMGKDLYDTEPLFREEMDRCFDTLKSVTGSDIKEALYPSVNRSYRSNRSYINQTAFAQPVIFAIEYSLARLLMARGFKPNAMIGHSIGEYTAACLSGVISPEDALTLVALRGKWMQEMPPGSMAGVPLSRDELTPLLTDHKELSLAAVNSSSLCVVSGEDEAIETFVTRLKEKGHKISPLHTSHAFHSMMMDPVVEKLETHLRSIPLEKPGIPYISNTTGNWITSEQARDPKYWARHLRAAVHFADGLQALFKQENTILIEIGPGRALSTFARQHKDKQPGHEIVNTLRHPNENISDAYYLLSKIGELWLMGVQIDWGVFYPARERRRVSLPSYPFERRRYWRLDHISAIPGGSMSPGAAPLRKKSDIAQWFYIPSWKRSKAPVYHADDTPAPANWLVLAHQWSKAGRLAEQLEQKGHRVVLVKPGPGFSKINHNQYTIAPGSDSDTHALFDELETTGHVPQKILHLWGVTENQAGREESIPYHFLDMGFHSLLSLVRAVDKKGIREPLQITVVTDHMQEVAGGDLLYPEKAAVLGPVRVIPLEHPNISCRSIDIVLTGPGALHIEEQLLAECDAADFDAAVIAYRGHHRWVQTFEPIRLEKPQAPVPRLKHRGVYLITGGLGGIGMVLAEHLAKTKQAGLILTGRSPFPDRDQWDQWLTQHNEKDPTSIKIREIREFENAGAKVLIYRADAADQKRMSEVVAEAETQLGKINGIIHAAGLPDGALIRRRTGEMSDTLFASKIKGTNVLDRVFKDKPLDFFLLCSSVLAVDAPMGQVGYCAANAFLDAFAYYRSSREGQFTVSINWDGWKETGMAAAAQKKEGPFRDVNHPLFDRCTSSSPANGTGPVVYISYLDPGKHWVLGEHRIMGEAALPGTGYLEMVTAALADHAGAKNSEIREIYFMTPLIVKDNETIEVHTLLEKQNDGFTFRVKSRQAAGESQWREHAAGKIALLALETAPPKKHPVEKIKTACDKKQVTIPGQGSREQTGPVTFGPRWNTLKQIQWGDHEGLALLELPQEFTRDLEFYRLHPALMDFATSFMVGAYPGNKDNNVNYLPFSYKNLKVKGPLPQRIFSHVKYIDKNRELHQKSISFEVTVMDEQGVELVHIEAFTMMAVGDFAAHETTAPPPRESQVSPMEEGILSAEGIEAFERILGERLPQVVVSTVDLEKRIQQGKDTGISHGIGEEQKGKGTRPKYPRPQLKTRYVPPETKNQQTLVHVWQEFLSIEPVGVHDDFFELGGDSLKAITLTGKIHKEMDVEIPIPEFFNRPTIEKLARYIEEVEKSIYVSIEPVQKQDYYPQSSAQKRLFILNRFENIGTSYNTPIVYIIKGKPDKERIENTFKRLIERHEVLRTSFHLIHNQPVQRIHPADAVDFQVQDLQAPRQAPEAIIKKFIKPFDLSGAPLIRVALAFLQGDEYLLLIDIHHIIADGTSVGIFMEEFIGIYKEEVLPPLKAQYKDFTIWQNNLFQGEKFKDREAYWLGLYPDVQNLPRLNLAADHPRPDTADYQGDSFEFEPGKEEVNSVKLRELCARNGATLYMVLLAVFNVMLYKYTGQRDIIVGSHVEGRLHPDTRAIMGMFVNSLAMRNYPDGEKTYRQFLAEVKENCIKAFENQDMQFEELVDQLKLGRDAGRNPLFDVVFNVQNFSSLWPGAADRQILEHGSDISITPYEYDNKTAKFDIILFVYEIDRGISFKIQYSTVLFKTSTIEKMAKRYIEIIRQVVEDENIKLKDIKVSHDFLAAKPGISDTDFRF